MLFFVIPAQAGIQDFLLHGKALDTGFHRCDDVVRLDQFLQLELDATA